MTLGKRLRAAIKQKDWTVLEFQERLGPDGVNAPGSSYASIHRYLADKAEPSLAFLRAAADVLGVRYEWLAVGAPPRTSGEAEALASLEVEPGFWLAVMAGEYRDAPHQPESEDEWGGVLRGIHDGFGTGGGRLISHPLARSLVLATWGRLMLMEVFSLSSAAVATEVPIETGRMLGTALRSPLEAIGVWPGDLSDRDLIEFVDSLCQALRHLPDARIHPQPRPADG